MIKSISCMQVTESLAKHQRSKLRAYIHEWRAAARWSVEKKSICRHCISLMRHRYMAMCFDEWRDAATKARHNRWCAASQSVILSTYCLYGPVGFGDCYPLCAVTDRERRCHAGLGICWRIGGNGSPGKPG